MAFPAVASSSVASANGSPAPVKPSGLAVGDLMVLWIASAAYTNANANIAAPDGTWTLLRSQNLGATKQYASYWKIATSGDVAASTFPCGGGDRCVAGLIRITGVYSTTPILSSNDGTTSSSASALSSGITPNTQTLFLMLTGMTKADNSGSPAVTSQAITISNPSWTSIVAQASTDTGNQSVIDAVWANMTANPNTATGNATATLNTTYDSSNLQIIAIQSPIFVAPSLNSSIVLNQPAIIRKIFVTPLQIFSTINLVMINTIVPKWVNKAKSAVSSIINQQKS